MTDTIPIKKVEIEPLCSRRMIAQAILVVVWSYIMAPVLIYFALQNAGLHFWMLILATVFILIMANVVIQEILWNDYKQRKIPKWVRNSWRAD